MKKILLFITTIIAISLQAANGDEMTIQVHQDVDLLVQGRHDQWVTFPSAGEKFQNIEMNFTVGCATSGTCSHWDYDVDFHVGNPTGVYDSTIASYDTISTSPLVVDTNWNTPFEVIEWHELGRMVTPYGNYMDWGQNGYDNQWTHTFKYDVTDFRPLLQDSVPIRIHFHGWQEGFRGSTEFKFTEGNPTRDVADIIQVYRGGGYTDFAQFDADYTPSTTINLNNDVVAAKLKVTITGHGQDGEFTPINYTMKSNGQTVRMEELWRDDCDLVHVHPQGGTWIYSRANWCPGDAVEIHEFELTDFIQNNGGNQSINIDMDLDSYNPTNGANYSLSAQLITYTEERRQIDAFLDEIIAPSDNENFVRFNPICDNPSIRIKNYGLQPLTSCQIEYWVDASNKRAVLWEGNLAYGETEDVVLPTMDWANTDMTNPTFHAQLKWPNNLPDQFVYNNSKTSSFNIPDVYDINILEVHFRANDKPEENSYTIKDIDGNVIIEKNSFTASAWNDEDVVLPEGCYVFEFNDFGTDWDAGDGLSWWVNTQNNIETAGQLSFRNTQNNQTIKSFNADFGRKIYYPFLVKTTLDSLDAPAPLIPLSSPTVDTIQYNGTTYWNVEDSIYMNEDEFIISQGPLSIEDLPSGVELLSMYPNPTNGNLNLFVKTDSQETIEATIFNAIGKEISSFAMNSNETLKINMNEVAGIYIIQFMIDNQSFSRKFVIK